MAKPQPNKYETSKIKTENIGQTIEDMMKSAEHTRRGFERKAYDNNFFDDGYHFRYVSRTQNKIVDLTRESELYQGVRAIPKASRQIRGMVNLLVSNDYIAKAYPDEIDRTQFAPAQEQQDPQTGQVIKIPNPELEKAIEDSKLHAKRVGWWIDEMMSEEEQDLKTKIAFMATLAAKNAGISYLQIWPDSVKEKIKTKVRDFFDVYLLGDVTEMEDEPFVIIATPRNLAEIKADNRFDEEQRDSINPDNRLASSEIKQAYKNVRFGREFSGDQAATVIQKEAYIKEYLNGENFNKIKKQKNAQAILQDREFGDPVFRQVFAAGNVWLRDEYTDLRSYPLVDFRWEYGPMYQTAPIERFIPANKSLDVVSSRVERYLNAFPLGIMVERDGEQRAEISNAPGGQRVRYKSVPPQIVPLSNLPPVVFNYMSFLDATIQEQGLTTSTLGQLPKGVKGFQAIESLKESEFANFVMPDRMLRRTMRMIAEKFLELADQYYVAPQTVYHTEKNEPAYFKVIGENALQRRKDLNIPPEEEDVVVLSRKYKVDIDVQRDVAYTKEGRKAAGKQLGDYFMQLAQLGLIPPQTVTAFLDALMELFEFGPAEDIMQTVQDFQDQGQVSDQQTDKIKVAVAEVLRDVGFEPPPSQDERILETKVGVGEAAKDIGGVQGGGQ